MLVDSQAVEVPGRQPGRNPWRVALVGAFAGLMNGLIGMGGGAVIVPGLIWARSAQPRHAVVASLCGVLLLSSGALVLHGLLVGLAFTAWDLALMVGMGMVGAQVGTHVLVRLPARWLYFLFAGFCFFSAQYLVASALGWVVPMGAAAAAVPLWGLLAIGLASGFSSGLLGIGGGLIAILGLTLTFNTPVADAVVVALSMNIANAASGLARHGHGGRITGAVLRDVGALVPSAVLAMAAGSVLSALLPGLALRVVFGGFLVYVGLTMLRRGIAATTADTGESPPSARRRLGRVGQGHLPAGPEVHPERVAQTMEAPPAHPTRLASASGRDSPPTRWPT